MSTRAENSLASTPYSLHSWKHHVGALTEVPVLLTALGADAATVLASSSLTFESLSDPDNRIDYTAFGGLLANGANATGYPLFGLLVGLQHRIDSIGLLAEVMLNCNTFGEALNCFTEYQYIYSAGATAVLMQRGSVVDLVFGVCYPGTQAVDQMTDAWLATAHHCLKRLAGPTWRPIEVFLPHLRPARTSCYVECFGTEPRFNSDMCALRFPAYWLQHPISGASSERKRVALKRACAVPPDLVMQAYRGVRMLLVDGQCSAVDLAKLLHLCPRTLDRRLRAAGIVFKTVLDDVRFEVARQLLRYTNHSLDEVSASVAYAGTASFVRRFRQRVGTTPAQWRRQARDGDERAMKATIPRRWANSRDPAHALTPTFHEVMAGANRALRASQATLDHCKRRGSLRQALSSSYRALRCARGR